MDVVDTIAALREATDAARAASRTVGFVPTMGYLHEGHTSLMDAARRDCDLVVASIFVNPLQFGAGEDLASYPRDLPRDLALAEAAGVDVVLAPSVEEMYPRPVLTTVTVDDITARFEGASRPTHFAGVATVCTKLFNQVAPDCAVFGEKDFQQLAVLRQIVRDLDQPLEIVGAPIVRDTDGLAMSSRNRYLSEKERSLAPALYRTLRAAAQNVAAEGAGLTTEQAEHIMREALLMLIAVGFQKVDYVSLHHDLTLRPFETGMIGPLRILAAAWLGNTRLIDNVGVHP